MKNPGLKKYVLGFALIGLITLGLAVFTLMQGAAAKQDNETSKRAQEIADKLNDYIDSSSRIPENLDDAGISNVPSTIKYSKKNSSEYEFCVTYKAEKSYGGSDVSSVFWGSALRSSATSEYEEDDSYKPSSLYLPYSYKKGENCQTVKPYIASSRFDDLYNDDQYKEYDNNYDYNYYDADMN